MRAAVGAVRERSTAVPIRMMIDVAIVGGGPAGLAAALALGRSRKLTALFDGGVPRNATASYIAGFITQDRISPAAFRTTAHDDLRTYPTVDLHLGTVVERVERAGTKFRIIASGAEYLARRVLLTTGLLDEPMPLPGSRELWGSSLFQCPYCHAYEVRDRALAYLAPASSEAMWVELLRSWSRNVMLFTNGSFEVPPECRRALTEAAIPIEERRIVGLEHTGRQLTGVVVEGGVTVARDCLFFRPVQKQTPVVIALALGLDERGYVRVGEEHETSIPGIHAAGDLMTHYHGALAAAAAGSAAAHCINHALTLELVGEGLL